MHGKLFLILYTAIFFNDGPPAVARQADGCTSAFMSMDRMEAAVSEDRSLGNPAAPFSSMNRQVIIPNINFTCNGRILSWKFGAQWEGNSRRYTELQIWRSSGDGSYTKVGSTTIMLEEQSSTRFYQHTLTSPLPFQAGDILGYFQGSNSTSQLFLMQEDVGSGHPQHFVVRKNPSSQFTIGNTRTRNDSRYHVLINVQTDSAGCDCGFISLERMNILLGVETIGKRLATLQRQQISPDIRFTCDGYITKWIIGAKWANSRTLYPELQVWRNVENNMYHKINGTMINIVSESLTNIYKYDNFSPIPVLTGDILGVFIPQRKPSRLRLLSERGNGPMVYYMDTGSATESPVDAIDLQHMPLPSTASYLPLVTVEISVSSSASFMDAESEDQPSLGAGIGAGVAAVVVLLAVGVLVLGLVIVWRMRRTQSKEKPHENDVNITDNVYQSTNAARQHINTTTSTNGEQEVTTTINEAYTATNFSTSTNQAYEAAQHPSGSETLTYDYIINY